MRKLNFAILGAGWIASLMAATVQKMDSVVPYAIASRDLEKARQMASRYGFNKIYGSYEDMLNDTSVDLVYIATPHSHHARQAKQCLESGKHVLCEKAFTVTADEARSIIDLAHEKKLLITEAIWPRYMPMTKTLQEFCASGRIGRIHSLTGNLGCPVIQNERIYRADLAGGALLDVGIYPLTFASIVFGDDIQDITSAAVKNDQGVDVKNSIILTYRDGRMATLYSSVLGPTDRTGVLYGETGYAIVNNINNFESLRVFNADHQQIDRIDRPAQITGYEYEVEAAVQAILGGELECPEMPHQETILMMELMDRIRHSWGLWYPGEK